MISSSALSSMDLDNTPAGTPPKGVLSNLHGHPVSEQSAIIGVSVLFYILTTIFVSLRCYSAVKYAKQLKVDDYFTILAVVATFSYMGFLVHLSYASRHMWDVPMSWLFGSEKYWKLRMAQNLFNPIAFFFSRVPVFILYRRMFYSPVQPGFGIACWVGIVAAFLIYVHTFPLVAVLCAPRSGDSYLSTATFNRCSLALPDAIVQGVGNVLLDLYALLLPQPIVWNLKLSMKKKLGVAALFAVGSIALIASCISLYYRVQLDIDTDTNWNEGAYDTTSIVELNIAIICSCAPAIWRLVKKGREDGSFLSFSSAVARIFRSRGSLSSSRSKNVENDSEQICKPSWRSSTDSCLSPSSREGSRDSTTKHHSQIYVRTDVELHHMP